MDDPCWKTLPTELIQKIIEYTDDVDVRLDFKIRPKKIAPKKIFDLDTLLRSHNGIFYNLVSKSLHIFRVQNVHLIRRPIEIHSMDEWGTVLTGVHVLEMTHESGEYFVSGPVDDVYFTELKVKLVI